ncbi:2Fe-2S iron-sulfur cluster binding domain-containing protein [Diaporthe helianthi]|uniref:2Fe-2S iron-sulfur cluster binding domain-containing protein n=1 Tax=Diaporthe helianthi TaxID=158607 RepID=A0A2P5HTC1_DIAHE|nr:2Fe-2S iron-sulfur cluster binding domain-containing protein [Diaporthe helianthi]
MATPRNFARALTRLRPSTPTPTPTPSPQFVRRFGCTRAAPVTTPRTLAASSTSRLCPLSRRPAPSIPVRLFSTTPPTRHGHVDPPKPGEELWVTFIDKDGQEHKLAVAKGDNLLDIAQAHDLEMEVENEDLYDKMPEPDDDENDMLDLAFGLTETSRLGCQVVMTPELDGLVVKLPSMTRNLQASDFK